MNCSYFFNFILRCLFPDKCLNCQTYTHDSLLCLDCFNSLKTYSYFTCPQCHKKIDFPHLNFCHHPNQTIIKCMLTVADYGDPIIKTIIQKFKYEHFLSLTQILDNLIQFSLLNYQDYFQANNYLIIPVPLHWIKAKRRGFNQSIILSQLISKFLNVPYNDQLLIRYKNNPSQAKISDPILRQKNVTNIFKINDNLKSIVKNKNIILVDDVFTTGSTLNECAKILKQNGANLIVAICLAK